MELSETALKEQALTVAEQTHALKVVDSKTYETMATYVLTCRKIIDYFEELYRPRIKQADAVTKGLREDMRNLQAPALAAKTYGDGQLVAYDQEQERIAKQKQLQQQREQKEREDRERAQLAALAVKAGDAYLAQQIVDAPNTEPTVIVNKETPKVQGLSYRDDWKWEILDEKLLPREYLIPDIIKIGKIVRALKQTSNIPGVRVYSVKVPIGRG